MFVVVVAAAAAAVIVVVMCYCGGRSRLVVEGPGLSCVFVKSGINSSCLSFVLDPIFRLWKGLVCVARGVV